LDGAANLILTMKEIAMDRLRELIDILSDGQVQERTYMAKCAQVCKICQKPAADFQTSLAKDEYQLSTICESCQKYYY
jgi:hypothetical protein